MSRPRKRARTCKSDESSSSDSEASSASSHIASTPASCSSSETDFSDISDIEIVKEIDNKTSNSSTRKRKRTPRASPPDATSEPSSDTESSSEDDSEESDDPDDHTDDELSSDDGDGYADATRAKINEATDMWQRYCRMKKKRYSEEPRWGDPIIALQMVDEKLVYRYFCWRLKLKKGKGGRRMKGTKKTSAIETPWKYFLRHYERSTKEKLNETVVRKWKNVKRKLEEKFQLDNQEEEKTPMYIEDLVDLQITVLKSFEKRFYIGLQRMQACLYNLLSCFTINRISALLHLQYKHLRVFLQRDPHGGRPLVVIGTTHAFAKKYLGMKQINTFTFPEIINDPSLMLSPHTFLLGMLLYDDAFKPPRLKSMDDIQRLWVGGRRQQMKIPLKPSKMNHYVFCKTTMKDGKVIVHRDKRMSAGEMARLLKVFGEILGYLRIAFARRWRYGGGRVVNESGLITEAKQNLIMTHANIRTFINHYLPRNHHQLDRLMRGRDHDAKLERAMDRMGASIDPRRPRDVPPELKATIPSHPEVQAEIRKLNAFQARRRPTSKKRAEKFARRLERRKKNVRNAKNRRLLELRKQVREEFDEKQALIDIDRQLSGKAMDEEAREALKEELPRELVRVIDAVMTWPTSRDVEDEWKRRNESVESVRAYCSVLEGGPRRGRRPKRPASDPTLSPTQPDTKRIRVEVPPPKSEAERAREHILEFQKSEAKTRGAKRPRACFHCLKWYSRPADVTRHLRRDYLPYLPDDEPVKCPFCGVKLEHKQHLQSHILLVYGTLT